MAFFGGTFDPVHNGHLIVARSVAEQCGFERIILVPASQPPHKGSPAASAEHRLNMLRLATAGEDVFEICEDELNRTGPSYTLDTLLAWRRRLPQARLHWIIGADMLGELPSWHRVGEVLAIARLIVMVRPPQHLHLSRTFQSLRGRLAGDIVDALEKSVVDTPLVDISSTQIRERAMSGDSLRFFTGDSVIAYINNNGLYAPE